MTTIYIKDRGIIKPGEESGTAYTASSDIANDGDELPLKGISISYSRGLSFDNKPQPGTYEKPELNFVSITAPVITISGQIRSDGDLLADVRGNVLKEISGTVVASSLDLTARGITTNKEIDILHILDLLCDTRGYKELYYKDDSANTSLLYGIGNTDTGNSTYRHVHVLCKGLRITENAGGKLITWQLTCEVMKGE